MLNFVAVAFLAFMVSGPLNVAGSRRRSRSTSATRRSRSSSAATVHLGILIAPLMVIAYGFLLFRTTRGFEIRVAGASPGRRPLRRDVAAPAHHLDDVGGRACWPGWPAAWELLGTTHYMTASYGTTVGFDAIAVALLGRTSPIGIVLAALLFGAMHGGASAMQIQAGVPAELVGVLQATILFFLVASPVIKRVFRLKSAELGPRGLRNVHEHVRRRGEDSLMDQFLYGIPVIGLVFEFIGYLIAVLPVIAPITYLGGGADRIRRPVRRHVRAVRRREHRDRGDDAELCVPSAGPVGVFLRRSSDGTERPRAVLRGHRPVLIGVAAAVATRDARVGAACLAVDLRSGPTRSSAARSSTSPPSA